MEDPMEALLLKASIHIAELDRIAQRAARMAEAAAKTIARVAVLENEALHATTPGVELYGQPPPLL